MSSLLIELNKKANGDGFLTSPLLLKTSGTLSWSCHITKLIQDIWTLIGFLLILHYQLIKELLIIAGIYSNHQLSKQLMNLFLRKNSPRSYPGTKVFLMNFGIFRNRLPCST